MNRVALIGPVGVGKSTISTRLASELSLDVHAFDAHRRRYYEEVGFDMDLNLELAETQGMSIAYQYWKTFTPHALERLFGEFERGVFDIGGGAPVAEHPVIQERIAAAFSTCDATVYLRPYADLDRSMELLRSKPEHADDPVLQKLNRYLMQKGTFDALATHVVNVEMREPEVIARDVLAHLRGAT